MLSHPSSYRRLEPFNVSLGAAPAAPSSSARRGLSRLDGVVSVVGLGAAQTSRDEDAYSESEGDAVSTRMHARLDNEEGGAYGSVETVATWPAGRDGASRLHTEEWAENGGAEWDWEHAEAMRAARENTSHWWRRWQVA